jgi:hypothetical protein
MNQSMNQRDMFFKWLYYAGAVLLLVLVQSLVLNRISVWAVHPFLPPVIAGIMAMLEGPAEGAVFGLLCDLTMPGVIPCFYTLAFLAAALPAAMIAKRLLSQGFLCAVLCAALALVITDLLHTVLLTFRQGVELSAALSLTGRELAVTVVLSPLVYLLLRSVHNRILR